MCTRLALEGRGIGAITSLAFSTVLSALASVNKAYLAVFMARVVEPANQAVLVDVLDRARAFARREKWIVFSCRKPTYAAADDVLPFRNIHYSRGQFECIRF